jgi:hypothetical protein
MLILQVESPSLAVLKDIISSDLPVSAILISASRLIWMDRQLGDMVAIRRVPEAGLGMNHRNTRLTGLLKNEPIQEILFGDIDVMDFDDSMLIRLTPKITKYGNDDGSENPDADEEKSR